MNLLSCVLLKLEASVALITAESLKDTRLPIMQCFCDLFAVLGVALCTLRFQFGESRQGRLCWPGRGYRHKYRSCMPQPDNRLSPFEGCQKPYVPVLFSRG